MAQSTTDGIKARLAQLNARALRCEGAMTSSAQRRDELVTRVGQAKARQALHDEVQLVFQTLQSRAHQRSVGAFEDLLSAILEDVLPEEGRVRLGLTIKANTPSLDVFVEKNGKLEGVYEGNGGGVTNVVCAGLRFAALSRTSNRRLMVLDEPDIWLNVQRIPAFIKVLADVAAATKTQTFFISHYPQEYFEGLVNVVELSQRADGTPVAALRQPALAAWTSDDEPGIRAIELENVRRHHHTFIPCLPGATALVGDNNLGKSTAIVTALRAVAYNDSDETLLQHDQSEARITLHLEQRRRLVWSRNESRSPVVVYELYEGDEPEPLRKGRPPRRGEAPDWVQALLGVTRVDDLDIQLGSQKTPVFLLDQPAPKRAQILSVGRESGHLRPFMKAYDDLKQEDREFIKTGEAEAMRLNYRLQAQPNLDAARATLNALTTRFEAVEATLRRGEALDAAILQLQASAARVRATSAITGVKKLAPLAPLPDSAELERLTLEFERSSHQLAAFTAIPKALPLPALPDSAELRSLGVALRQSSERLQALGRLPARMPAVPALPDDSGLSQGTVALDGLTQQLQLLQRQVAACDAEVASLRKEEAELLAEAGGRCPLCRHELSEHTLEEHVHA